MHAIQIDLTQTKIERDHAAKGHRDHEAELARVREALVATIPLLWHDKVCDFASAFTKDCSCRYGQVYKQVQAALQPSREVKE